MDTQKLIAELIGKICRCGGRKKSRETFCGECYLALPQDMRRALYRRVSSGYEEAYSAAVEYLERIDIIA